MPLPALPTTRNPKLALLAGLAMPGLGQIYNGDMIKGLCFFIFFGTTPVLSLWLTALLPSALLFAGTIASLLLTLAIYTYTIIDAYRNAAAKSETYSLKKYNQWYIYLAFWVTGSLFTYEAVFTYTQHNVLQFCKIETGSMEPALFPGDFIIADRTYYHKRSPKKGDIILFVYPDDRSRLFIKRIEGLPGDTILSSVNNDPQVVPHGSVFVLGDNKEHAVDSRTYGAVPLADVLGKARQVYFSLGEHGVRWKRIGIIL